MSMALTEDKWATIVSATGRIGSNEDSSHTQHTISIAQHMLAVYNTCVFVCICGFIGKRENDFRASILIYTQQHCEPRPNYGLPNGNAYLLYGKRKLYAKCTEIVAVSRTVRCKNR